MQFTRVLSLILLIGLVSACGQAPPPPPTPTLELPTHTTEPPTFTPSPSPTAVPTSTQTPEGSFPLPLPQRTPASTWEGIAIMSEAIAGDDLGDGGYIFTTLASPEEIERFYLQAMGAAGFAHIATAANEFGGLFIVFDQAASVSVRPINDEVGTQYVVIIIDG